MGVNIFAILINTFLATSCSNHVRQRGIGRIGPMKFVVDVPLSRIVRL